MGKGIHSQRGTESAELDGEPRTAAVTDEDFPSYSMHHTVGTPLLDSLYCRCAPRSSSLCCAGTLAFLHCFCRPAGFPGRLFHAYLLQVELPENEVESQIFRSSTTAAPFAGQKHARPVASIVPAAFRSIVPPRSVVMISCGMTRVGSRRMNRKARACNQRPRRREEQH